MRLKRGINLKHLLALTLFLALLMVSTGLLAFRKAGVNMLRVLEKEGFALLESLVLSSENTLKANDIVESLITERLLDIARVVDSEGKVGSRDLAAIAGENRLKRIDLFNLKGQLIRSSSPYQPKEGDVVALKPILEGETSQLALTTEGQDFAVALARADASGVVVCYVDGSYMKAFQQEIGIGYLIQSMGRESGIDYILLQSQEGILFATKNIAKMRRIEKDPFLSNSLSQNKAASRRVSFEGRDVLEVVKPFYVEEEPLGLFRLGLSLAGYEEILRDTRRHTFVLFGIFFLLGIIAISLIIVNQNYSLLKRSYHEIKTFTGGVLQGIGSGVVAVDPTWRITIVNPAAEDIFAISRTNVMGRPYAEVFPDDDLLLAQVKEKGRIGEGERRCKDSSGRVRILAVAASALYGEGGELQGAVSLVKDVTQLKSMQEKMRQRDRLSALGDLAAGVGHEIRNPLNAISLTAQRLEEEFSPDQRGEEFGSLTKGIREEVERLDNIVRQFLSLARPPKLNLVPCDLKELLEELLLLRKAEMEARAIDVQLSAPQSLTVEVDKDEMKRALLNVFKNSVEAMEDGGRLTVAAKHEGDRARIEIRDTGKGIPEELIPRIWEPYFSTKENGTGLGLAMTHKIVTDHDGTIEVESSPGEGTTFTITLPVRAGSPR